MEPLFDTDDERPTNERGSMETTTKEALADLERQRTRFMEELAEIAVTQKAAQSEIRRVEREMKVALKDVDGYTVPEDRPLTQDDVEAWCQSEFFKMAHTMPANPHCYFARKAVRDPDMYERVVGYVIANGYEQQYGGSPYTVLDVRMNSGVWFLWPMTDDPTQSQVLNLKPDSMRPEQ